MLRIVTIGLFALPASSAFAQQGMFVGLGLGSFDYEEVTNDEMFGDLVDKVAAYKIFGGFEFNEYLAAEISYGKSDSIGGGRTGTNAFIGDFASAIDTEFTTTVVKVVGQYPRDWGVLLGGIGYYSTDAEIDLRLSSSVGNFSSEGSVTDDGLAAMVGIEWRFGRFGTGYGVRLEYEWWDFDGADAATLGLGISFRF